MYADEVDLLQRLRHAPFGAAVYTNDGVVVTTTAIVGYAYNLQKKCKFPTNYTTVTLFIESTHQNVSKITAAANSVLLRVWVVNVRQRITYFKRDVTNDSIGTS